MRFMSFAVDLSQHEALGSRGDSAASSTLPTVAEFTGKRRLRVCTFLAATKEKLALLLSNGHQSFLVNATSLSASRLISGRYKL